MNLTSSLSVTFPEARKRVLLKTRSISYATVATESFNTIEVQSILTNAKDIFPKLKTTTPASQISLNNLHCLLLHLPDLPGKPVLHLDHTGQSQLEKKISLLPNLLYQLIISMMLLITSWN